jgi:putative oxidoreductase
VNIVTTVTRLLLGAGLVFAGGTMYFFGNPPPQPGLAGQFDAVFFASHYALFVGAVQLAIGVLLLLNRFVPVALIMLAAFVYNSFAFHATMAPSSLWAPFLLVALALPTALRYRTAFAAFLSATPVPHRAAPADTPDVSTSGIHPGGVSRPEGKRR